MPNCFDRAMSLAWFAATVTLLGGEAWAQSITVDGRLGPAQTLAGPSYAIGAGLGRQVGGNLFHSFGAFGLKTGETATFSGPASVGNVIGRVTGRAMSSIDGGIKSTVPGANLYLVNPSGVVFGPNATVNVGGSFHASSADYLRMKDGARFQAANPDASTLSAAPPEAFGFLSASPQLVAVNGSNLQLKQGGAPQGSTLGLVGGDVTISGGVLVVPGGTVHIASAAGPGEVPVDPRAGPSSTVARSGRVQVANNSTLYPSGGSVFIRAGELSVSSSVIVTDNNIPGQNGVLSLHADRAVAIQNRAAVVISASGPGHAPGISIGTTPAGTVTVNASTVATNAAASGNGGPVAISTGTLTLQNGAVVVSNATDHGVGGPISMSADSVLLDGLGTRIESLTYRVGLVDASGAPVSAGTGGTISLTGRTLSVQNQASIEANTFGNGTPGSVNVAMTGNVAVTDGAQIISNSNTIDVTGTTATTKAGDAGRITLIAGVLTLVRGGTINSDTYGVGNGGEVALTVGGALTIDGAGAGSFRNGVSSEAGVDQPSVVSVSGSGGQVRVSAGSVSVLNGGFINSNTRGTGAGGSVLVTTPGALLLDGGGVAGTQVAASALGPRSGAAGTVSVSAGTVTVQGRAQIAGATNGAGQGGDVSVTATSAIRLNGPGPQVNATATSTGNAGAITVSAPQVFLRDGASISSTALGSNGGNVTVGPGDLLYLQRSSITTSVGGASGNGGNIATAPRLVVLDRSAIQANAVGGNGGNVRVEAEQLVPSFDSAITASSQRGVSGAVLVSTPPLNLNGSLVVLVSDLRAAAALLREGCAVRGASPRSSLVATGRGGQRQGLEASVPALYFARHPVRPGPAANVPAASAANASATAPARISLGLSSACG